MSPNHCIALSIPADVFGLLYQNHHKHNMMIADVVKTSSRSSFIRLHCTRIQRYNHLPHPSWIVKWPFYRSWITMKSVPGHASCPDSHWKGLMSFGVTSSSVRLPATAGKVTLSKRSRYASPHITSRCPQRCQSRQPLGKRSTLEILSGPRSSERTWGVP